MASICTVDKMKLINILARLADGTSALLNCCQKVKESSEGKRYINISPRKLQVPSFIIRFDV